MKNRFLKLACLTATLSATLLLSACGGGGGGGDDDNGPAPVQSRAEGVYDGRVSNGGEFQLIILENDQFYSLFGTTDTQGVFRVISLLEGQGRSNNGSFSANSIREYVNTGFVSSGSLSGTYVPRTSISGSLSSGAVSATFTGNATPTTNYNYDTPATLAAIAGNWPGQIFDGENVNFSISGAGNIVGQSQLGCGFTGTATPRSSGKNVYDVRITFGSANCAFPGMTAVGAGLVSTLNSGGRQLLVAINNSARTAGAVIFATR